MRKLQLFRDKWNLPAAVWPHVSHKYENVIKHLPVNEHPDRWGLSRKPADDTKNGEATGLPAQGTSPEAIRTQGGGSEMELLSSQQEIICLIKDFPPFSASGPIRRFFSEKRLKWSKGHPGPSGPGNGGFPASIQEQGKIWLILQGKSNTDPPSSAQKMGLFKIAEALLIVRD